MNRTLVFNGWSAGPELWDRCTFAHDYLFSYIEQLDGLPERVMDDTDRAMLVGFSMGGSTALRLLLAYPQKVAGLVLVSATPRMMEEPETNWRGMSPRRLAALVLGTSYAYADDPSPLYAKDNLMRGIDYLRETDLRTPLLRLGATSFPVCIFQSVRDGIVRPENAEFLAKVFPQAQVMRIPGNEHALPVTIPDQIDAAVRKISEFTPLR